MSVQKRGGGSTNLVGLSSGLPFSLPRELLSASSMSLYFFRNVEVIGVVGVEGLRSATRGWRFLGDTPTIDFADTGVAARSKIKAGIRIRIPE